VCKIAENLKSAPLTRHKNAGLSRKGRGYALAKFVDIINHYNFNPVVTSVASPLAGEAGILMPGEGSGSQ